MSSLSVWFSTGRPYRYQVSKGVFEEIRIIAWDTYSRLKVSYNLFSLLFRKILHFVDI